MLPTNKWVFLALTTNTATQKQNGFRYTLPSTTTQTSVFDTRGPTGAFYDLSIDATIFIGNDGIHGASNNWLQYVRMYLNYFPNSVDEMINLATMDTGNIYHVLDISFTSLIL